MDISVWPLILSLIVGAAWFAVSIFRGRRGRKAPRLVTIAALIGLAFSFIGGALALLRRFIADPDTSLWVAIAVAVIGLVALLFSLIRAIGQVAMEKQTWDGWVIVFLFFVSGGLLVWSTALNLR